YPNLRVRMGVHSGPVKEVTDLNEQANIAGAGINMAQRVMDCGDAGHILLSKRVADDLEQYGRWRPLLHDLGICEVKHGATLGVVNLYSDEFGNPETPKKFKAEEAAEKKPSVPILRKSIALLPFENLSEDKATSPRKSLTHFTQNSPAPNVARFHHNPPKTPRRISSI